MRISDWSSDVCSSDLAEERDEEEQQEQQRQRILDRDEQVPHLAREACPRARLRRRRLRLAPGDGPGTLVSVRWCRGDRKRVGGGKRVAVRVDLGGRRGI